ncbi:hypothetical protein GCM10011588_12750 [Nocardia jinanensis]|uniref:Uncharacterized protein n=1 Tax=Nocardia jinanensis TaxID=382504 RepID=A0A917RCH7_9NOCA|nr:hypothetical protein GCM10011588_12750 [Nocardia jinanensis]
MPPVAVALGRRGSLPAAHLLSREIRTRPAVAGPATGIGALPGSLIGRGPAVSPERSSADAQRTRNTTKPPESSFRQLPGGKTGGPRPRKTHTDRGAQMERPLERGTIRITPTHTRLRRHPGCGRSR